MLFSSIPFLYYFLPIVLAMYFIVPKKLKNSVLLLSSLVFYGWGEPKYLLLMVASIITFYLLGLCVNKAEKQGWKKFFVVMAVAFGALSLGVFKYADFFIDSFNKMFGSSVSMLKLALPIGISFYTFQCLSYVIDVYRKDVPVQKNIISFGAYVSLFPQLIAGPIVRYSDVATQLDNRTHSIDKFIEGFKRFVVGLAKKIIIANQIGALINIFRDTDEKSIIFYWIYAIGFSLHIYFDFSGYSDMAIGLGKIFGFDFIENFNYPYISKSISEFWRRWHMSLGTWFRDYVYIPLGGNRVSSARWIFNVFVVWMLTGLWHGAAWNFVLWGVLYGVFLVIEKKLPAINKIPTFIKRSYTLVVVMFGFVLFNATDLNQALSDIIGMFDINNLPIINSTTIYYLKSYSVVLTAAILGSTPIVKNVYNKISSSANGKKVFCILEPVGVLILLAVCTAYLVDGSFNPFLYFRF